MISCVELTGNVQCFNELATTKYDALYELDGRVR